jgi:hypothetical protein
MILLLMVLMLLVLTAVTFALKLLLSNLLMLQRHVLAFAFLAFLFEISGILDPSATSLAFHAQLQDWLSAARSVVVWVLSPFEVFILKENVC